MAPDGVDFVDENDARRILFPLLKQIPDAACAHADEHLDKVRTGDGEKRDIRLTRDGAGEQGLSGARRSDEKHSLRNAASQLLELLRLAQELDNLLQLFLCFFNARYVFERDFFLLGRMQTRPA